MEAKSYSRERKYSVLMAVHASDNSAQFRDALESIASQSLMPTQFVLVKDGPLNSTLDRVIDAYLDVLPIEVVSIKTNQGLGVALRKGLLFCKYEIVARADSDDINLPNRFETQVCYLLNNADVDVVGSNLVELYLPVPRLKTVPSEAKLGHLLFIRNPVNHQTVVFRKSIILEFDGYEDCRNFEDYLLWCKLLKNKVKISNLSEPLVHANIDKLIEKRSGHSYALREWNFYLRLASIFPSYRLTIYIVSSARFVVRHAPYPLTGGIYKLLRRKKLYANEKL